MNDWSINLSSEKDGFDVNEVGAVRADAFAAGDGFEDDGRIEAYGLGCDLCGCDCCCEEAFCNVDDGGESSIGMMLALLCI